MPGVVNLLVGPREHWRTGLPTFRTLSYEGVWDGIEVEFNCYRDRLECRFTLQPEGHPGPISLDTGPITLYQKTGGALSTSLGGTGFRVEQPMAWHERDGLKIPVGANIVVSEGRRIGYRINHGIKGARLVLVQTIFWSTFIGTDGYDGSEQIDDVAIDSEGSVFVAGRTSSPDFPVTTESGSLPRHTGSTDLFVTKFMGPDMTMVFSSVFGGSGFDCSNALDVDETGCIYLAGYTNSPDFPCPEGMLPAPIKGESDIFVLKLNRPGTAVLYSTLVGGSNGDIGCDLGLDGENCACVTGYTTSPDFPVTSEAFNSTFGGRDDVFAFKLSADGSGLVFSTYLGGTHGDQCSRIAIDSDGCAYVTGETWSPDFPATAGAFDLSIQAGEIFVSKLGPDGDELAFSTALGGRCRDRAYGIAVDPEGCAVVVGSSSSPDYPTTPDAFLPSYRGAIDGVMTKLNPKGTSLIHSTFLGGCSHGEEGLGIATDGMGGIYLAGMTSSSDFPATPGAFQEGYAGGDGDAFIMRLDSEKGTVSYTTFLGGSMGADAALGVVADAAGNVWIVGETTAPDFPVTPQAFDRVNEDRNAFVARLSPDGKDLEGSTFLGGDGAVKVSGIALGPDGGVYVSGNTWGSGYPTTDGAYDTLNECDNVFVSKLEPNLSFLGYSTFLGSGAEGCAIAVDDRGCATVTGYAYLPGFPVTPGAYDNAFNYHDAFVTKLNRDGSGLVFSTFLGGVDLDTPSSLAVDALGCSYIVGQTYSADFPNKGCPFDAHSRGELDVFLSVLSENGSSLLYSACLGGRSSDYSSGLALDGSRRIWVSGYSWSDDFPVSEGAIDPENRMGMDAFLFRLSIQPTGDLNLDGLVDSLDLLLLAHCLAGNLLPTDGWTFAADIDLDGVVDAMDLSLLWRWVLS